MAGDIKIDAGSVLSGIGSLAKDLRSAITGEISPEKKAEILLKTQELENAVETARLQVMIAEASSQDKWTSRARPSFMYVMYTMILASLPMGVLSAYDPSLAKGIAEGMQAWLKAVPTDLWYVFGIGYTGYTVARSKWDKHK